MTWRRLAEHGAILVSSILAVFIWGWVLNGSNPLSDARSYWSLNLATLYNDARLGGTTDFLYSPAFAQVVWPLTFIPWLLFAGVWTAILLAVVLFLGGPVAGILLLVPPVLLELRLGNVNLLIAAALVLGLRWPVAWSFVLLTKVTPGIGLLWFAVRREWRHLAVALAATGAIVIASAMLAPDLWRGWLELLGANAGSSPTRNAIEIPLPWRLALAAVVVGIAARKDWPALLPLGVALAMPALWTNSFSVLVASVYLVRKPGFLREHRARATIEIDRGAQ